MTSYVLKRLVHGLASVIVVIVIVMLLVYGLMNRQQIFTQDQQFSKVKANDRTVYMYQRWEEYGYLDYVPYGDYLDELVKKGEIDSETRNTVGALGRTADSDEAGVAEYVQKFTETYESKGYTVQRLKAITSGGRKIAEGGRPQLFAYRDKPLLGRALSFFLSVFKVDNIHYVPEENDIGERGLTFTWNDPAKGGDTFAPVIMGNGTQHKYLLYFDGKFPYIHQNFLSIQLGKSYSVNKGIDVFQSMTQPQGSLVYSTITYPTGLVENSADDLHTATYSAGSRASGDFVAARFADDYTITTSAKHSFSKMGFSFSVGIFATVGAYLLGLPLGIAMSLNKDGWFDKLGTIYVIFITSVPSLAYIFIFRAIGGATGVPTEFTIDTPTIAMYILPIVSLMLPSVGNLMKWMRRYMIDQMNSDYVKFARAGGLSEREIFFKHIMKNAAIPIAHGIPGSLLFSMTGSLITERVYRVPGMGDLMITAIQQYDNGVIIGVTLFFALLSIIAAVAGDVTMAVVDPRINFTNSAR